MKNKISGDLLNLDTQRKIAKVGMTASLGVLTLTAFNMKNRTFKTAHKIAGTTMIAFSVYHAGLYDNGIFKKIILKQAAKRKQSKRIDKPEKE